MSPTHPNHVVQMYVSMLLHDLIIVHSDATYTFVLTEMKRTTIGRHGMIKPCVCVCPRSVVLFSRSQNIG